MSRRRRFGATPSLAFGVQVRELIGGFPGSASYLSEEARFAPSVGHQLVPDWQVADMARKAAKQAARRETMRFHTQRQEAVAAARQRKAESVHDARMVSLISQRQRYLFSVAAENHANLRAQATFRHTCPKEPATGLSTLNSPRG